MVRKDEVRARTSVPGRHGAHQACRNRTEVGSEALMREGCHALSGGEEFPHARAPRIVIRWESVGCLLILAYAAAIAPALSPVVQVGSRFPVDALYMETVALLGPEVWALKGYLPEAAGDVEGILGHAQA